jgi:hypothetical protein
MHFIFDVGILRDNHAGNATIFLPTENSSGGLLLWMVFMSFYYFAVHQP